MSNNIENITGYNKIDLLNKNCNVLLSHSIGKHHNDIIKVGIDRGLFRHYNKSNFPLIMKKKNGVGLRVSLEFQVHSHSVDTGVIGKLKKAEKDFEKYALIDISKGGCKLDAVS